MTGLILKDLLMLKKTLLYMAVITLVFSGVYTSMDNDYFVIGYLSILVVSIVSSSVSYDEFYHWDRYAAILPLSRRRIVGSKYLTALLLFAMGTAFGLALMGGATALRGGRLSLENLLFVFLTPMVGLVGVAVMLPVCYRFGAQQGRIVIFVLYGVPSVLLVLALKLAPELFQREWPQISEGVLAAGGWLFTAAALAVSFLLSVRILEKKELK